MSFVLNLSLNAQCTADFSYAMNGCNTFEFTDTSTPPANYFLIAWWWDFGDGFSANLPNPIHNFPSAGIYNVTLTITADSAGYSCSSSITQPIQAFDMPTAMFSVQSPNCEGGPTQLTDYSTTQSGYLTTWDWDFGDGNTQTVTYPASPNVTHTYANTGTYAITLTVTSSDGCMGSSVEQVTITPSPIALFSWSGGYVGSTTTFQDESTTNGSGLILSWIWNFGDPGSGSNNTSLNQNPTHVYSSSGSYEVTLIILSYSGCSDTNIQSITVNNQGVEFTWSAACVGDPVQFTVDGTITNIPSVSTWNWSFGDGSTSNLQNPIHAYTTDGIYSVTLAIMDIYGDTYSVSHDVQVNPLPNAQFQYSAPTCKGDSIHFIDQSSSSSGYIAIWEWDFGDGTMQTILFPDNPNVSHLYLTENIYEVTLTVTDSDSCGNTCMRQVQVVSSPIAEFTWEDACFGTPILFTDLTSQNSGPDLAGWNWDFGDPGSGSNNSSILQNPGHIFTNPGEYTINLVVTNTLGCDDTITHNLTVSDLPDVSFSISNDYPELNELVQFTGESTSEIISWFWDFDDGGIAITQSPQYIYTAYGQYAVSLAVIGLDGCTNEASHMIHVYPPPVFPDSNAIWNTIGENNLLNQNWHFRYGLIGDTLMSATKDTSFTYNKIYQLADTTLSNPNSTYFGAIRSTPDKKVFVKLPGLVESLLYDYTLESGDTAWFSVGGGVCRDQPEFWEESHYKVVTSIDSVMMLNYEYRKRWHFDEGDTWIEGLGSVEWFGLFNTLINTYYLCGDFYSFVCFKEDDVILYINQPDCETCFCDMLTTIGDPHLSEGHLSIYPNPARGFVTISIPDRDMSNVQLLIYNWHGQILIQTAYNTQQPETINVKEWKSGLYVVVIRGDNGLLERATFVVE